MGEQFTPGPWSFRGRYVGTPNHMSFIAECRDQNGNWTDTPHSIANARLIAAAPDLLEALIALVRHKSDFDPARSLESVEDQAAAAINKALGQ